MASPPLLFALLSFRQAYLTDLTTPAEAAPASAWRTLDTRTVVAKAFLNTELHFEYPARSRASTARAAGSEDMI